MKKLFYYLLLIPGIVLFISCDDEEETLTATGSQRYFALYFDVDRNYETNVFDIDVSFMTSDLSEVPEVTVNGTIIDDFEVGEGLILYGNINNLQYSTSVNYSVSLAGKTTSGSIEMPSDPYNVMCNGVSIIEGQNTIPQNNSFNISWLCNSYDYFRIYWNSYNNYGRENITNNNYTVYSAGSDYYSFSIYAVKGSMLNPGSQPNVTGDYGKGYVFAESDEFYFYWDYYTASIQRYPVNAGDDDERINYYKDKFYELISTK